MHRSCFDGLSLSRLRRSLTISFFFVSRQAVGAAPAKRRPAPVATREYLNLGAQIDAASKLNFDDPRVMRGQVRSVVYVDVTFDPPQISYSILSYI